MKKEIKGVVKQEPKKEVKEILFNDIFEKLFYIQQNLKVGKTLWNDFNKFKYRSCETILEALKPELKKTKTIIGLSDEIVQIGDRFYVKATATLKDKVSEISNISYARESLNKKGSDEAQITGATSSYARKYALNGLFGIDDEKDADTKDNTEEKIIDESDDERTIEETKKATVQTLIKKIEKSTTTLKLAEWKVWIEKSKFSEEDKKAMLETVETVGNKFDKSDEDLDEELKKLK